MHTPGSSNHPVEAIEGLRAAISGEVRDDRLARALYATDASIYQIVPDAVVLPRTVADVVAAVRICGKHGLPLTARGAGTGLTGGAVNRGVQLDCSRYLTRIMKIDAERRTATVEPGVVLDELNAELRPHNLQFAPDVATSSRATIGGMIANNSCGAHSVLYGRTVDHVLGLDVVLSDGSVQTWGRGDTNCPSALARDCENVLATIARDLSDEIAAKYPKILRNSAGYGLDRLRIDNGRCNPETIVCGSEGTLCIVVGATLNLTPLPKHKGLVIAHFDDLLASLAAAPDVLEHRPAAVELVDKLVLDAARTNAASAKRCGFITGDPQAILIIELYDDDPGRLMRRLRDVARDLEDRSTAYAQPVLTEPEAQSDVWDVRTNGLGLLMSRPGDAQPYAFVEDSAVAPSRLRDYITQFQAILADERIDRAGCYAHASVGCLHVRPVLNLKRRGDVERMRRIADRVSSLALQFGGTMTAEHGDGIVRSGWLEKMYGPRILQAFRTIKRAFDPNNLFNPGKIVSPLPMTENLRYELEAPHASARAASTAVGISSQTTLDFSEHGGMAGLAGMCSGLGKCRQRLVGTMCPSYAAIPDEMHTTRGRANALRMALSRVGLLEGLSDPALDDVMDLCLGCKACKTECPTGVDMARLKAEWLHQQNERRGIPLRSRLIASVADIAALGSWCAPLSNKMLQSPRVRGWLERFLGLDRRMPPPLFAQQTFRQWIADRQKPPTLQEPPTLVGGYAQKRMKQRIVYFADTWTNYYTPQVGIAAVKVLEALGCEVIVPPVQCCGRPAISKGLLSVAKRLAEANVAVLAPYADADVPIIGTEPSCVLTLSDELPQLVRSAAARRIAGKAITFECFVADLLARRSVPVEFAHAAPTILYHGHCHQKVLLGTADAMSVLRALTGGRVSEINSGCCGMAGSFGHEVEHYEVARAIGEHRLFPAVRARGEAEIAVSGFSCRHHLAHHTNARPRHVAEYLADALAAPAPAPVTGP